MKRDQILPAAVLALILGPATFRLLPDREPPPPVPEARIVNAPAPPAPSSPQEWFRIMRPRCTAAEVRLATDLAPPPAGPEGRGYRAACFALAEQIPSARADLLALTGSAQTVAAGVLRKVATELTARGEEAAAVPLLELAAEFEPARDSAVVAGDWDAADPDGATER